ncbi:carbohydrate kinase family protein [Cellulomonas soli]|uniref:Sugar kinase n=1 Tax=Cellulomonas soli TaxID=931535 RepID=A0A512PD80_9CELL|nr:carbohydrate kinase family protein [Cellulomonas soli]NYI60178.1 sugar/nucleoside kinase (ribokinase family) [Cellulomonas soli]GEP69169.1 sugar kinase [Cellulomonas soli]
MPAPALVRTLPGPAPVLVVGPASWNTLVQVEHLPDARPQTLFARGHHDGLGGTSAGKAVTLAALGTDVVLATLLGDDEPSAHVRAALTHPRLRLLAAPAQDGRTERHLNLMADDGSRVSVYLELPRPADGPAEPCATDPARPVSDVVRPEVLAALERASVAVVDLADHARPVLAAARAAGVPVWCDVHDDDGWAPYPRPFADAADVLLVSDVHLDDPAAYLRARVDGGSALAVCTRGASGALALDADGWIEVPAAPAPEVVDTNGAGDAFLAGLLHAQLSGAGTLRSLALAAAVGALAVGTRELGAPHATSAEADRIARTLAVRRV